MKGKSTALPKRLGGGKPPGTPGWDGARIVWWMGGVAALLLLVLTAGCGKPDIKGELSRIADDKYRIEDPSPRNALATGVGCGGTQDEALINARRIAKFNLRSLTGPARYSVSFKTLRTIPDEKETCVEVSARATP